MGTCRQTKPALDENQAPLSRGPSDAMPTLGTMADEPKSAIAARIAQLRGIRGWSQQELADAAGVSKQSVYYWERGTMQPAPETQSKLAAAFGVTVSDLHAEGGASPPPVPRKKFTLDDYVAARAQLGVPLREGEIEILRSVKFRGAPDTAEKWGKIYRILCLEDE